MAMVNWCLYFSFRLGGNSRSHEKEILMPQYSSIASEEYLYRLEKEHDNYGLRQISKHGQICVDENTKSPYIIYDNVRYDIEPIIEQVKENNERNIQNTKKI